VNQLIFIYIDIVIIDTVIVRGKIV